MLESGIGPAAVAGPQAEPLRAQTGKPLRVLIAGGGTGGHVIPALAIARELRDHYGAEVHFLGTARGIETQLVPAAGFPLELIRVGQLNNVSMAVRARTLADLPLGLARCVRLLRLVRPHVVIGVGGYASGPAMIVAILLRLPTLAYEPNAIPGMTNRLVGSRVSAAAVNYPQTLSFFRNAQVTGVPVRPAIFELPPRPAGAPPHLLVTAGSQGARIFNETMPKIAQRLLKRVPGLTIMHQAGARALDETREAFAAAGADPARYSVEAFLTDMPAQYAAADLVLARSGSTVSELAAAGKPSLLVPFPQAADDHQRKNAEVMADAGAAVMLLQKDATEESLENALADLLLDAPRRAQMAQRAQSLARPGALEHIAAIVLSLAGRA
jgi:UDP-N-acetylglucosamine--N-acetylmuramyl-(pentapeptide) pyrophosphoryl-undecaprenol N-acetylglucosamine transferase